MSRSLEIRPAARTLTSPARLLTPVRIGRVKVFFLTILATREARVTLAPLDILHEDNHCLAVFKPAGVVSAHYQGKEQTLDRAVKAYLKEKYQKTGNVFLGIVHRL